MSMQSRANFCHIGLSLLEGKSEYTHKYFIPYLSAGHTLTYIDSVNVHQMFNSGTSQ